MATIDPANLSPDAWLRVRGVVITRLSRGRVIVQAWPRKRGTPKSWKQYWTVRMFSIAARMAANSESMQKQTANFQVAGTVWLPRDLLVRAAYGKAYEVIAPDGTVWQQADHSAPEEPETWAGSS